MRYFFIAYLAVPLMAIAGYALTITDDFNRNSLGSNWESFIENASSSGGSNGIVNDKLVIDNGSNGSIGDNFAFRDLGQNFDDVVLSGILNYKPNSNANAFYIGLNAHKADILDGEGANYRTTGKGYGVLADFYKNDFVIVDQTSEDTRTTSDPSQRLTDAPLDFDTQTDLNFELVYKPDNSLEARFWRLGNSRPTDPVIQYTPGREPEATGTYLFLGITDEGTLKVDELTVTSGNAIPEPLSFTMLAMSLAGFCLLRKLQEKFSPYPRYSASDFFV